MINGTPQGLFPEFVPGMSLGRTLPMTYKYNIEKHGIYENTICCKLLFRASGAKCARDSAWLCTNGIRLLIDCVT